MICLFVFVAELICYNLYAVNLKDTKIYKIRLKENSIENNTKRQQYTKKISHFFVDFFENLRII